ncbi:MAG: hypothetical protein KKH40_02365, partial [Nanoarchaeota archaeon]|nr:hypothetical protein [Nanoarchaeota archaeon]
MKTQDKIIIITLLVALLFISACSKDNEKEQDENPLACTREYRPVCGVDEKTYPNACTAGNITIAYEGECKEQHVCTEEEKEAMICTMDYTPVCGNNEKTYSNGCTACSAGVDSWI